MPNLFNYLCSVFLFMLPKWIHELIASMNEERQAGSINITLNLYQRAIANSWNSFNLWFHETMNGWLSAGVIPALLCEFHSLHFIPEFTLFNCFSSFMPSFPQQLFPVILFSCHSSCRCESEFTKWRTQERKAAWWAASIIELFT